MNILHQSVNSSKSDIKTMNVIIINVVFVKGIFTLQYHVED